MPVFIQSPFLTPCGNSAVGTALVTQPGLVSLSIDSVNNLLCHGYSTGSATAIANPGTPPYSYNWSGGNGTNATATGLSAGTYTVSISDSCGNTATTIVTLTEPAAITIKTDSINTTNNVGCNGEAWVTASGGTPPYSYLWTTGGQTTDTIKGQCAGSYCCVVSDNKGCESPVCVTVNSTVGIESIQQGGGNIMIYPNPNTGIFTIEVSHFAMASASQTTFEIFNVLGEKVHIEALTQAQRENIINLSQPDGVYLYRLIK